MKKFLNSPETFVEDMLQGIYAAHSKYLTYVNEDTHCLVRVDHSYKGKVGIATGGGSGHLPLFLGYVGQGMLDGCSIGDVFQSPSADQMLEVTKAIDNGAGVLYIYGNYNGDILNFDMATEMADIEGIKVLSTVAGDDVASSKKGEEHKRRGVAGIFFVYKCAGAKAEELASLEEVKRVADKVASNTRTIGVALSACIVPQVGKPSFTIGDDEMEIGMGIHGEPGIRRGKLSSAKEVVTEMTDSLLADLPYEKGDEVAVLINGLGGTPKEELYIIYKELNAVFELKGIKAFHVYVGEFATSMEMQGFSISLCKLDDELKYLVSKPAYTPFFEQIQL